MQKATEKIYTTSILYISKKWQQQQNKIEAYKRKQQSVRVTQPNRKTTTTTAAAPTTTTITTALRQPATKNHNGFAIHIRSNY